MTPDDDWEPDMRRDALYIMTDARGYTTCCAASRDAMFREAGRIPLLAPITVTSWTPIGDGLRAADWRRLDRWVWKGGLSED